MKEELFHKHLFTPGPVKMSPEILQLGARQPPYFRNKYFSQLVLDSEAKMLDLVNAPEGSRVIFLTASGTGAMEAVVMNLFTTSQTVAVIDGGTFGRRFVDICLTHHIPVKAFKVDRDTLSDGRVSAKVPPADALLINGHETSVGHLYDLNCVGAFCKENKILHVVDAISMFGTDVIDMQSQCIDTLILSSHKGLALPPGLAFVVLSPEALSFIGKPQSFYFDFARHLKDGERGQTPFTPAVSIMIQLHARLEQLMDGGLAREWNRAAHIAAYFRSRIMDLPLEPYSNHMPNAMTALRVTNGVSALRLVEELETVHHCVVAPNGGDLKDTVFRVSHMGDMTVGDVDTLVHALRCFFEENK